MANEKKIEDYLHLYLGCEVQVRGEIEKLIGVEADGSVITFSGRYGRRIWGAKEVKPLLRQLSDITEEDFYSWWTGTPDSEILVKATINNMWCAGWFDKEDYEDLVKEDLPREHSDLIYELEESDHEAIISCTKSGIIAHGCGDEMRYFVDIKTQSDWINHLRKRNIDCDGLIETGQAIDKNTLQETKN